MSREYGSHAHLNHPLGLRKCIGCKRYLPTDNFYPRYKHRRDLLISFCKDCNRVNSCKQEKVRAARFRRLIDEIKRTKPCADCKTCYPPVAMDFDHRPSEGKVFEISDKLGRVSLETLMLEIEKCDIVCANCHRIRTHRRRIERKLEAAFNGST